jgi:hypothetical protein
MRLILPNGFCRKALLILAFGCHHDEPPVAPGDPIPAEPDVHVDTLDVECDGLVTALQTYGECPNNDDDDRAWAKQIAKVAEDSFAAGKKGNPDEKSQRVIAVACHKATASVQAATTRCRAGKRPRSEWQ